LIQNRPRSDAQDEKQQDGRDAHAPAEPLRGDAENHDGAEADQSGFDHLGAFPRRFEQDSRRRSRGYGAATLRLIVQRNMGADPRLRDRGAPAEFLASAAV
jgi:hypothetical protein